MRIFEEYNKLTVVVKLKNNIKYKYISNELNVAQNHIMCSSSELRSYHKSTKIKTYTMDYLNSIEREFKPNMDLMKNELCKFEIKSNDEEFIKKYEQCICVSDNELYEVIHTKLEKIKQINDIKSIYTLTPVVTTIQSKQLFANDSNKEMIKTQIIKNTIKKYNMLTGDALEFYDFIKDMVVLNKKPIVINYKNITNCANKFIIFIKPDRLSQTLGKLLNACGVGEKTGQGYGFTKANMKEVELI